MTISAGTHLGPYEILAPVGAGGMGEVYRARDTRLERDVAIKVLPEEFLEGEERKARFEREARLLASLNHPGIAAIYSFEEIPGSFPSPGSPPRHILVMELLEGENLRERLHAGPMLARKAVDFAAQIAHALAAAHEKGIVHRDLKPENVFLTKGERVKLLDFGLAKTLRGGSSATRTQTATESLLSEAGVVMGTVGYMSPEQVRGEPADHRSDIFSLGTIVFEMLAGSNPFRKETGAETMTAILKEEPPPLPGGAAGLAPVLPSIVGRCLEKKQAARFQSASDLAFALSMSAPAAPTAPRPRRAGASALALAAGVAIGVVIAWTAFHRKGGASFPVFTRVTFQRGFVPSARFSPDGQTIVYGAAWDGQPVRLFSTRTGGLESRPIDIPGADILSISRHDDMALLLRFRIDHPLGRSGTLARAAFAGGPPRDVLEGVRFADWAPDGVSLAVARDVAGKVRKARLEYPIGTILYETTGLVAFPRVSPSGDEVAFLDQPVYSGIGGVVTLVTSNGTRRALTELLRDAMGLAWSPKGNEIWFSAARGAGGRGLHAVDRSGRVRLVLSSPGMFTLHDISREGRVLLAQESTRHGILVRADGALRERELSWLDGSAVMDVSPDGKVIVGMELSAGLGSPTGVFLRRTDGTPAVRLGDGLGGKLSPDGRWVAAVRMDPPEIAVLPTGAGEARTIQHSGIERYLSVNWMPDGKRIVFSAIEKGHGSRLFLQALDREERTPISPEDFLTAGRPVSPDGSVVAALGPAGSGFLVNISGGSPRELPGLQAGEAPICWSEDGRKLFVGGISPGATSLKCYSVDTVTGRRELWREIMPPDPAGLGGMGLVVATPDWKVLAYSYHRFLSELYVVEGLK